MGRPLREAGAEWGSEREPAAGRTEVTLGVPCRGGEEGQDQCQGSRAGRRAAQTGDLRPGQGLLDLASQ